MLLFLLLLLIYFFISRLNRLPLNEIKISFLLAKVTRFKIIFSCCSCKLYHCIRQAKGCKVDVIATISSSSRCCFLANKVTFTFTELADKKNAAGYWRISF